MELYSYINQEVFILIAVLYVVGVFIRNTPNIPNWVIPWVLLIIGIAGGCFIIDFNVNGVMQGILAAGFTVFGNQLIKQTKNRD